MFLIVLLLFTGCFSYQILPTSNETSSLQSFEVVAMEPPPLIVTKKFLNPGVAGAYGPGAGVLVLVFGVVAIIDAPNDYHESIRASKEYQDLLSSKDIWIPTEILAKKALEILELRGKGKITLRPGYLEIPSIKYRERSIFMENWYAPIRAWYNETPSLPYYERSHEKVTDVILEVGILNYELYGDNLILHVMVKLLDTRTGRIIGRARNSGMLEVDSVKDLFLNDALGFKDAFSTLGFRLLNECLIKMSLLH
jgi:hypothetical protein